jgi:aryl-alcohol dehydrogenase-like predicted oxidoreductase
MNSQTTAANAGTIDVGGDLTVNRLGFGAMRITGPGIWGDPPDRDMARAALRRAVELGVTFIDTADSIGALDELKAQGKIRHVGVSNFSEDQFHAAERVTPVVSVQNRYNAADRSSESMVDLCEQEQLVFLPWAPVLDTERNTAITDAARRHGASPQQIVLAWLLARSPQMLPIPGSGSAEHVAQNVAAASIALSDDEVAAISKGG